MIQDHENIFKHTAIVDADPVIWIACNKNKTYDKYNMPIKEDGKLVYTDKTLQEAYDTCDSYITDILFHTKADSYVMYLSTGKPTFRYYIDTSYKSNRAGLEKPMWFKEVKQYLRDKWGAVEVDELEADDLISITKNHLKNSYIIASDKDILDCIPGRHFDARRNRMTWIDVSYPEARYNFARSILTGDSIDGIPNLIKGMGPKTAESELNKRMDYNNPVTCALLTYVSYLGEREGFSRFTNQYMLLKLLDNLNEVPKHLEFKIPSPICFNCVEAILSQPFYNLEYSS